MFQDEAHLWQSFQQGNIKAFEAVYERHAASLLAYGKRLCPDHHLVKDLVQDIFIDLWTRRRTLRDLHTIRYYLFRIMRNRLAKLHQKTGMLVGNDHLFEQDELLTPPVEWLITQQEANTQQSAQLRQALAQLPDRQREAVMLAFYHNFSNEEIAGIMDINQQSVINHLSRAVRSLRTLFVRASMLTFFMSLVS